MLAEILSRLFPVQLPRPLYPDDVKTSMDYRYRTHGWEGRNENPDPELLRREGVTKARKMALVLDAEQDGKWSIPQAVSVNR